MDAALLINFSVPSNHLSASPLSSLDLCPPKFSLLCSVKAWGSVSGCPALLGVYDSPLWSWAVLSRSRAQGAARISAGERSVTCGSPAFLAPAEAGREHGSESGSAFY